MTIRHLKIFVAVCECGGMTKAADILHMTQPAVSNAVSEMEKYYKVVLFDRIKQRLALTETGKTLLLKAKGILNEFEDFETLAMQGSSDPSLHIGCSLTLGKTFLPGYLKRLQKQIPAINPGVIVNNASVIEQELENGNLDFGFVEGEVSSPYLKAIPFGKDRIVAICASDAAIPGTLPLAELVRYPLLLREKGSASRDLFDRSAAALHCSVTPMIESISNQCLITSAMAGLGIAVLPEGLVSERICAGAVKQITVTDTDFSRIHYLLTHKNKKLNPIQKEAYRLCMDQTDTENIRTM